MPDELADAARRAQAAVNASAAAAASGIIPLGATPAVAEAAFEVEQPTSLCAPVTSPSCFLDALDFKFPAQVTTVGRLVPVLFTGWAADNVTGTVPPVVLLELVGAKSFRVAATRLTPRSDVALVLKMPALVHSGYDVLASFRAVDPGEYAVHVLQVTARGTSLRCDTRRKIRVE